MCLALTPAVAFAAPLQAGSVDGSNTGSALQTQAKNMKASGVRFDLKVKKPVTFYSYYKGVGKIRFTATLNSLKTTVKNGVKTTKFTITHKLAKNLTSSQVKKMFKALYKYGSMNAIEAYQYNHFVDYNTGRPVNVVKKDKSVKWEKTLNQVTPTKTYRESTAEGGAWFYLTKKWKATYVVTSPKSYKGLCIGVGGGTVAYDDRDAYDRGYGDEEYAKYTYFKTSYFKGDKKNTHFIYVG